MRQMQSLEYFQIFRVATFLFSLLMLSGCSVVHNIRTPDPVDVRSKDGLMVMTFNIRVGYGIEDSSTGPYELKDKKKNLPPIVAAIRSVDPDIVGLQEVLPGQAGTLAKALNMNYVYSGHTNRWWGLALLSKYEILEARSYPITHNRTFQVATVDVDGKSITFVNVHTPTRYMETDGSSFRMIKSRVDSIDGPIVLTGDLNAKPISVWTGPLGDRFVDSARIVDTPKSQMRTFGLSRFDYVLVDPRFFEVQDVGLVSDEHAVASDHLAYYARLRWKLDF